ncbi:MAG: hypothetical protein ACK5LS_02670 [Propioniciclava sp.]
MRWPPTLLACIVLALAEPVHADETPDEWSEGAYTVRLTGRFSGTDATGAANIDARGSFDLLLQDAAIQGDPPFILSFLSSDVGVADEGEVGSADVTFTYDGSVTHQHGKLVLQAQSSTTIYANRTVGGSPAPSLAQTNPATTAITLTPDAAGCGLVQGTWNGSAVQDMMLAVGGGTALTELVPPRFVAASAEIDGAWLARADDVGTRMRSAAAQLDEVGPLADELTALVSEAEALAEDASTAECGTTFTVGIGAATADAIASALLRLEPRDAIGLARLSLLAARGGILPGSPVHHELTDRLDADIRANATDDAALTALHLQTALALGETATAATLQQRLADHGRLSGAWLTEVD